MDSFYGRRRGAVASLAVLLVVLLGLSLGFWQLRRADEKAALQLAQDRAATAPPIPLSALPLAVERAGAEPPTSAGETVPPLPLPAEIDGRRVKARGTFIDARSIFLDNRSRESVAGFHVLTPLKLAGREEYVLVLRGWAARDAYDRNRLPVLQTPAEAIEVEGLAVVSLPQPMMLGEDSRPGPGDRLWQHFNYEKFSAWSGIVLYPVVVRQTVEPDYRDGLARDWIQPGSSVDRHVGYAFQWFALTAAAAVTWLVVLWRRRKESDNEE
jgi:surfeit locus 1 family protein